MAGSIMPSGGADPQDWYYLNYSMPGALSRRMQRDRICDPLWPVYGCKTAALQSGGVALVNPFGVGQGEPTDVIPKEELPPQWWDEWAELFRLEEYAQEVIDSDTESLPPMQSNGSLMTLAKTAAFYGLGIGILYLALEAVNKKIGVGA